MGSIGNGTMTHKLNYSTSASKPSGEIEFKHTVGSDFGKYLDGAVCTKTFNSGNPFYKYKLEKGCGNGTKWTFESNCALGLNMPPTCTMTKPNLTLDFAKEKHTSQIIIKPSECFKGLESAALNTTIAAGPVHLGLSVGYGIKDGAVTHAAKLAKSANGLDFAVGMSNANDINLAVSKAVNKNGINMGICSFDLKNVHLAAQYSVKDGNWGSQLALEHTNCQVGSLNLTKGKWKLDLKTLEYAERATIKVNDNVDFAFGAKSKMDGNFFNNFKVGAAINFTA